MMKPRSPDGTSAFKRWVLISLPPLLFILVPFFLFGARMDEWATTLLGDRRTAALAFGAVALLLVADVALPIPSSVVSTMGGAMLGAPLGAAASWVGMTAGSVFGYALGAFAGRGLLRRLVEPVSVVALERDLALYGVGLIAVGRAVPVVAEATTIIAGASRMEFCRFFLVSAVANLGISIVYATVGALSAHIGSFLLAVAGSVTLPAIAWWLVVKRRSKADTPLGGGSGSK